MRSSTGGDGRFHLKAATSPDLLGTAVYHIRGYKKNGSSVLGKRNKQALQSLGLFNLVSRSGPTEFTLGLYLMCCTITCGS